MTDAKKIKARKLNKSIGSGVIGVDINKKVVDNKISDNDIKNREIKKKIKSRKIKMFFTAKEEKQMDKQMEVEENVSVTVMIVLLFLCFIVGISLGYALYKIAINSSNAMFIVRYLFD